MEYYSRKDRNFHLMEVFMQSDALTLKVPLYSREVDDLRKNFPQVEIRKGAKVAENGKFVCTIEKKEKV